MSGKEESIIHINEEHYDGDTDEVMLLDISSNKQWMAYVAYNFSITNDDQSNNTQPDTVASRKKLVLTRRTFTATDETTGIEELGYNGDPVEIPYEISWTHITDDVMPAQAFNCRFLSISNDGIYVALSFLEIDSDRDRPCENSKNLNCFIFEVNGDSFKPAIKMKCQGRAVFLNRKGSTLAIISKKTIEVYEDFSKNRTVTYVFRLSSFYSNSIRSCETVNIQKTYVHNTSWFNMPRNKKTSNIETLVTFTRHIRHNILTTPFTSDGVVRIWSLLEDGARLTSFPALKQHVMAFSKNYKYAAAYVEDSRSVNVYNVKSGLLVYRLKSRDKSDATFFKISHIRFCYDARYVAMSGLEDDSKVVFEVWYVEAERSIYKIVKTIIKQVDTEEEIADLRRVEPFVRRGMKNDKKCLKGYYTSYPNRKMTIMCVELDIDRISEDNNINWESSTKPEIKNKFEIENGLKNFHGLKCRYIEVENKKYLLRFGKHTVQLWDVDSKSDESSLITKDDNLLYIRAYKGPDYGIEYSFRETWEISGFDSIRYTDGNHYGRLIVNIRRPEDDNISIYHTEEIFLSLDELFPSTVKEVTVDGQKNRFDYHKLESACQALHYLFMGEYSGNSNNTNLILLQEKTNKIIESAVCNIKPDSNFFSTIAGSRTLAMLASFKEGRVVIKSIMARRVPISIFGYARTRPKKDQDELLNIHRSCTTDTFSESNMPDPTSEEIFYRSSPRRNVSKNIHKTKMIASKENVLTVLIDEQIHDLYTLIFNCILADSRKLGPGCLSSLTDALLYLQGRGNYKLLLSSSAKLSYLAVEKKKLGILQHEFEEMADAKVLEKKHITDTENLEAHATMEQIKMYKGSWLHVYHLRKKFLQWLNLGSTIEYIEKEYNVNIRGRWRKIPLEEKRELDKLSSVCVVPITHFNSYNNLPEDRPRADYSDVGPDKDVYYREESAFVRVALDQHISDMFQQGDIVLELLLKYKWQHFARSKFILICLIHAIYYVSYCTGVLFAPELYGQNLENKFILENSGQIVSIVLMLTSLLILIIQEARQFSQKNDKLNYFFSGYNWIDISAFVLPLFTLIQLCLNWPQFVEVCSVSTLVLWTHAILRLRVISHFGITLETIIQLSKKVAPMLLIMLLVVLAFTQSYIVLLRLHPDDYFRDTFSGTFLSENSPEGLNGIVEYATSTNNGFVNCFVAFYNVWLFIYGVWDPIVQGDAGLAILQYSSVSPRINIGDPNHDIQLLDILSNKKWIAYVTYYDDGNAEAVSNEQNNYDSRNIFIARQRFTAVDQEPQFEKMGFSGNIVLQSTDLKRSSIKITKHINDDKGTHYSAKNQHIMAHSTGYNYAAAYANNTRSVNVYNVKSGLLVYRLKSREMSDAKEF
ncbi:hypothetical protein INT48_003337 [Thamnidium elegans]|uniref:Uncharacterized protein n=1 Tax=Thamnidium elegans TaxID=101142 RepID=A0A8H7VW49_9FUNG|nr:hypothetical protein INT48_003337 [Thamnidium elegans]